MTSRYSSACGVDERHVQPTDDAGQGRSQFVGRMGDELFLRFERRFKPFQHPVEGMGELEEFVPVASLADPVLRSVAEIRSAFPGCRK